MSNNAIGTHSMNVIRVVLSMTGIRRDIQRCVRYVQEMRAEKTEKNVEKNVAQQECRSDCLAITDSQSFLIRKPMETREVRQGN